MKNVDELVRQDPKTIAQQIIDYIISQEGVARATKSLRLAAVVTFYSMLNRKRLGKFLGPSEEIAKMLKVSDERMKCVVKKSRDQQERKLYYSG